MSRDNNNWVCINNTCGRTLGYVVGGEFQPEEDVNGENLRTRGPNLVVTCPDCGSVKVWYTADPLTRSIHQLVDVMSSSMARRSVNETLDELRPAFKRMMDELKE